MTQIDVCDSADGEVRSEADSEVNEKQFTQELRCV